MVGDADWDEEAAIQRYSPNPAPTGELYHLTFEDRGILFGPASSQSRRSHTEDLSSFGKKNLRKPPDQQRYISCLVMLHAVTSSQHTPALVLLQWDPSHVAGQGKSVAPFSFHTVSAGQAPTVGITAPTTTWKNGRDTVDEDVITEWRGCGKRGVGGRGEVWRWCRADGWH